MHDTVQVGKTENKLRQRDIKTGFKVKGKGGILPVED